MPNYDQTGPAGQGPRTGKGMGPCGMGLKRAYGNRGGCRCGYRSFISPKNIMVALEEEEKILEEELQVVREEKNSLMDQKK